MSEKLATIKIRADLGDAQAAFAKVTKEIQGMEVSISSMATAAITTLDKNNKASTEFVHTIQLASKEALNLKNALDSIKPMSDRFKNGNSKSITTIEDPAKDAKRELDAQAKLAEDLKKLQIQKNKESSALFHAQSAELIANLNSRLTIARSARENGASSIKTIELQAAQDELNIRKQLASDLAALDAKIADGSLNRFKANAERLKLTNQASTAITGVQQNLNTTKTAKSTELEQFQSTLKQKEAALAASISYQTAIEQHGIGSIQAARVQAANQTKALQAKLNSDLTALNNQVTSGAISTAHAISNASSIMSTYEKEILKVNAAYNAQARAVEASSFQHKNLLVKVGEIVGSYRLVNAAINAVQQSLLKVPTAGIEQQATQSSIFGIMGTKEGAQQLQFLQDISQTAGQNILVLEQTFRRFAPSALLAGTALDKVDQSFKDFSEVGAILHLTEDKMDSLFLALDQMFAKGVVQSEEVKKQLGNVLPAAVEIGAKAMGKSPAAFMKAMKDNEVTAKEFVPKFAELYRKIFGGVDDSVFTSIQDKLFANLMRLKTNYENFNRGLFDSSQEIMNAVVKNMSEALKSMTENLQGILQGLSVAIGLVTLKLVDMIAVMVSAKVAALGLAGSLNAVKDAMLSIVTLSNPVTRAIGLIGAGVGGIEAAALSASGATVSYERFVSASKDQIDSLMAVYAAQGTAADQAGKDLERIAQVQEQSNSLVVKFQGDQIEISSIVEASWNNVKRSLNDLKPILENVFNKVKNSMIPLYESITGMYSKLGEFLVGAITSVSDIVNGIIAGIKGTITGIGAAVESMANGNYSGLLDKFTETAAAATKKNFAQLSAQSQALDATVSKHAASAFKYVSSLGEEVNKGIEGTTNEILLQAKRIQDEKNKAKQNSKVQLEGTGGDKPIEDEASLSATKASKLANGQMKVLSEQSKQFALAQKAALKELEAQYAQNQISVNKFYSEKERIESADIQNQIKNNEKAKAIAASQKDSSKVEVYATKQMELEEKLNMIRTANSEDRRKDLEDYNSKLREVNETVLNAQGKEDELALSKVTAKYKDILEKVKQNDPSKVVDINKAKLYEETTIKVNKIQKEGNLLVDEYNAKLQNTTNLKLNGYLSESQAVDDILKLREETLSALDEEIAKMSDEHSKAGDNIEDAKKLLELKQKRAGIVESGGGGIQKALTDNSPPVVTDFKNAMQGFAGIKLDYNAQMGDLERMQKVGMLADEEEFLTKKNALHGKYNNAIIRQSFGLASDVAGKTGDAFQSLTDYAIKMYGAHSSEAKKFWALTKTMRIGEAIMSTAAGIMSAFNSGLPWPAAVAAAALTGAMGAVQIATIAAQPMPAAHGGLDYVPAEQTYLLNKGERVLSPNQNKDFTNYIRNNTINNNKTVQAPAAKQEPPVVNVRNINVLDQNLLHEWAGTTEGEQAIMNVVNRNKAA